MRKQTNHDHVQAVREGKDYYSPRMAINETIDHLVDCALIFKNHDAVPSTEARVLDALGVQICRELKNRAEMIHALTDRLQTEEAELKAVRAERDALMAEVERYQQECKDMAVIETGGEQVQQWPVRPELETAQFSG